MEKLEEKITYGEDRLKYEKEKAEDKAIIFNYELYKFKEYFDDCKELACMILLICCAKIFGHFYPELYIGYDIQGVLFLVYFVFRFAVHILPLSLVLLKDD